jgi:hypothetical protein
MEGEYILQAKYYFKLLSRVGLRKPDRTVWPWRACTTGW